MKKISLLIVVIICCHWCFSQSNRIQESKLFAENSLAVKHTFDEFHTDPLPASVIFFTSAPVSVPGAEMSDIEMAAIIGGISGLLAGAVVGAIAYPDNSGLEVLWDLIFEDDASGSLNKAQVPFIVGGALTGVAVGALIVGRKNQREKKEKTFEFEIEPEFALIPGSSEQAAFGLRFRLRM